MVDDGLGEEQGSGVVDSPSMGTRLSSPSRKRTSRLPAVCSRGTGAQRLERAPERRRTTRSGLGLVINEVECNA